jgi:hypothetical protein
MSEDERLSATGYRSRIEATGISQIREHVEKRECPRGVQARKKTSLCPPSRNGLTESGGRKGERGKEEEV